MQQPTQTYIVWFNDSFEEAEEVAAALNGQTVLEPETPDETPEQTIGRFMEMRLGYPKNLIAMVDTVVEYLEREKLYENTPSRSSNCYTAAVFVPTVPAEQDEALQDIAYLLKKWFSELNLSNYEEYLDGELSEEDTAWLYHRHQEAISQWMCEHMTDLYAFHCDVLWPLDNPDSAKWEVVYKWAGSVLQQHLETEQPG
ncbi:hypothetical protein [Neisseria sp. S1]|uniref:hypothetical protein n=1 Tax=Neisseria sp. S1 TaxID=3318354 RepID=UPI003A841FA0